MQDHKAVVLVVMGFDVIRDMLPVFRRHVGGKAHYDQYDGFVILHGTDTMAFTASALSFMLENLSKPVIVTGSQIPLAELRSDGHRGS